MTIKYNRKSRVTRNDIISGKANLRVVGSEKLGFRLAGERSNGTLCVFGQHFSKQKDAVEYGEKKFGIKAVKYAPNNARRKEAVAV